MALQAGERVLDVGCGGGGTCIAGAEAVGPDGNVVGVDVSIALIELARRRAAEAGTANVSFLVADAQSDHIEGGPFDVAASQFGVMFFDEPVTAFTNIRAHLRSGGRLAFVCWQSLEHNPWHVSTALRSFVPPTTPPAAGKSPVGPFVFGDAAHARAILDASGFADIGHDAYEITVDGPASAVADDWQLEFLGVPTAKLKEARAAVDDHLARFRLGPDLYRFPLAFIAFGATNP